MTSVVAEPSNPGAAERVRLFLQAEHEPHHYATCATTLLLDTGAHADAVDLMEAMLPHVPAPYAAEARRVVGLLRRASDELDPKVADEAHWQALSYTNIYRLPVGGGWPDMVSVSNLGAACDEMANELSALLEDLRQA